MEEVGGLTDDTNLCATKDTGSEAVLGDPLQSQWQERRG